jgi:hypothetical protein
MIQDLVKYVLNVIYQFKVIDKLLTQSFSSLSILMTQLLIINTTVSMTKLILKKEAQIIYIPLTLNNKFKLDLM